MGILRRLFDALFPPTEPRFPYGVGGGMVCGQGDPPTKPSSSALHKHDLHRVSVHWRPAKSVVADIVRERCFGCGESVVTEKRVRYFDFPAEAFQR